MDKRPASELRSPSCQLAHHGEHRKPISPITASYSLPIFACLVRRDNVERQVNQKSGNGKGLGELTEWAAQICPLISKLPDVVRSEVKRPLISIVSVAS